MVELLAISLRPAKPVVSCTPITIPLACTHFQSDVQHLTLIVSERVARVVVTAKSQKYPLCYPVPAWKRLQFLLN